MTYFFDAAALVAKGFTTAVVLAYEASLAEPRGTLMSKHKSRQAAERSAAGKRSDTCIVDLVDAAAEQARTVYLVA